MSQITICIMLIPRIKNILIRRAYNTLGNNKYKIHIFVKTHIQRYMSKCQICTNDFWNAELKYLCEEQNYTTSHEYN